MEKGVFKMTADAKVGLLLGLLFIVIIAFLVNGLPSWIQQENTSLAPAIIPHQEGNDLVLHNKVKEATHRLYPPTVRQTTPPVVEVVLNGDSTEPAQQVETPGPAAQQPTTVTSNHEPVAAPVVPNPKKAETHVVKAGETLAAIAKIHYGPEVGNCLAVIDKLHKANADIVKSANDLKVGQKLTIPPKKRMTNTAAADTVVKAPTPKKGVISKITENFMPVKKKEARSTADYTVQKGDSLWSIAEHRLGNGNRFREIERLNAGRIHGTNLSIGTRLIIPPQ